MSGRFNPLGPVTLSARDSVSISVRVCGVTLISTLPKVIKGKKYRTRNQCFTRYSQNLSGSNRHLAGVGLSRVGIFVLANPQGHQGCVASIVRRLPSVRHVKICFLHRDQRAD